MDPFYINRRHLRHPVNGRQLAEAIAHNPALRYSNKPYPCFGNQLTMAAAAGLGANRLGEMGVVGVPIDTSNK